MTLSGINTAEVIERGGLKRLVDVIFDARHPKAKSKALRLIHNFLSGRDGF
jgi:hypothetical protein